MKAVRFWMAALVMLGLILSCFRHVHLIPILLHADHASRGEILRENFVWKLRCVNLSGGFSRWILYHRRCNGVYLTPNGMLVKPEERSCAGPMVSNIVACVRALDAERSCRILYVQMPTKQSMDGRSFPSSFGDNFANANADELLTLLGREMRTVDLRPVVAATAEDVRQNFIRTDHHWNFEGAFKAFQVLVPILMDETGVRRENAMPQLNRFNWTLVGIPRPGAKFLGTRARRTGVWFAGYDQLFYLLPSFPVAFHVTAVGQRGEMQEMSGKFVDTMINWKDLRAPPTFVEDYAYNVYLGDLAMVEISNDKAPVGKSVFVVKNSMSQPLLPWIATVFAKVTAVDPRYHRGSFISDVRKVKPDIAVIATPWCRSDYYR